MVAAITTAALLLSLGNSGTIPWFTPPIVFSLVGFCLLAGLVLPFLWHHKMNRNGLYARLYNLVKYTVALNLAIFGWRKIFGLQFVVPEEVSNLPMNQQTGEWLTWYYFGHSPVFGTLIALVQIVGAYLLMFKKSFLPAALLLFGFMVHLTCINVFYRMNMGALVQSFAISIGLIYLLWPFRSQLIQFLKTPTPAPFTSNRPNVVNGMLVRAALVIFSIGFVIYCKYYI